MPSTPPDRYDPVPGLLELPGFLIRKLAPRGRRAVLAFGTVLLIALVAGAVFGLPAIRRGQRDQHVRRGVQAVGEPEPGERAVDAELQREAVEPRDEQHTRHQHRREQREGGA